MPLFTTPSSPESSLRWARLLMLAVLPCLVGCSKEDGIRQYSVKRIEQRPVKEASDDVAQFSTVRPQTWFFKLTGPKAAVQAQLSTFRELVQSVTFNPQGKPSYLTPEGWNRRSGPELRYETLTFGEGESAVELAISSLPTPPGNLANYQQLNLNRWRNQLGLADVTGADWLLDGIKSGELVEVPAAADRPAALIVNLSGQLEKIGEASMLAAMVTPPAAPRPEPVARPAPAMNDPGSGITSSAAKFDHTPPSGWTPSAGSSARLASLEVIHESGKLDISVTRFPNGGDLLSNVNRWRGQAELPNVTSDKLGESVTDAQIGGRPGKLVIAKGPALSILAAIVPDGSAQWFFKVQGPTPGVTAEEQHFQQWLESVKFPE